MSGKVEAPDLGRIISELSRRVAALERALKNLSITHEREVIFSYDGPLVEDASQKWVNKLARTAGRWSATLVTAGSTDTEIDILMNDDVVLTLTIAAGEYSASSTLLLDIHPGQDTLQASITTAGEGAEKLTVQAVAV